VSPFHDRAASLLLAQGASPRVIMETSGHSQIGTTMDLYAHVMPALQRETASMMDTVLSGKQAQFQRVAVFVAANRPEQRR